MNYQELQEEDRRSSIRCSCVIHATCDAPETEPCDGKVEDISEQGLGLILSRSFEPGTLLKVVLRRSDDAFLGVLNARVLRVTAKGDKEWFHGCETIQKEESK